MDDLEFGISEAYRLVLGHSARIRVPNSPTGQVSEARPVGQSELMSVTRPGQ